MYALLAARHPARRAAPRILASASRTLTTLESVKYTAVATASGGGRNGKSALQDGSLDMKMASPKEMGGSGDGHNPEQFFALGYAACFLGALRLAASQAKVPLPSSTTVTSHVHIGKPKGADGFGLAVDLEISVPEGELKASKEQVEAAVKKAHEEVCPYSNATRGNVDVKLNVKY